MLEQRQKCVLILGANGRLGRAATQAFNEAGWEVLAQARQPVDSLPARARQIGIDMANTDAIAKAAAGASAVVYAVNPLQTEWDKKLLPLARKGMDVAQRLGALFMLPGNVYSYGEKMPLRLVESTVARPSNRKGELRAALEEEMQTRITRGLRSVVIRAGDFYGAGVGNWFDQAVVKSLRSGKLVYPGPLDRVHAWAYLPDLARAFVGIAEHDLRRTLNAPVTRHALRANGDVIGSFKKIHFAGHNVTGRDLLDAVERAAVRLQVATPGSLKRAGMLWSVIRLVGLVYPLWRELAKMAYLWRVPHTVESVVMNELLPELRNTPIEEATLAALIDLGFGSPHSTSAAVSFFAESRASATSQPHQPPNQHVNERASPGLATPQTAAEVSLARSVG
ncbi:MAG: NAD-dependent epimerase/dehydratase family protein [Burkholderiales bacterium]|nr:NAD(P)H-binding protein [Nitrosomonadaceae bacterium]